LDGLASQESSSVVCKPAAKRKSRAKKPATVIETEDLAADLDGRASQESASAVARKPGAKKRSRPKRPATGDESENITANLDGFVPSQESSPSGTRKPAAKKIPRAKKPASNVGEGRGVKRIGIIT